MKTRSGAFAAVLGVAFFAASFVTPALAKVVLPTTYGAEASYSCGSTPLQASGLGVTSASDTTGAVPCPPGTSATVSSDLATGDLSVQLSGPSSVAYAQALTYYWDTLTISAPLSDIGQSVTLNATFNMDFSGIDAGTHVAGEVISTPDVNLSDMGVFTVFGDGPSWGLVDVPGGEEVAGASGYAVLCSPFANCLGGDTNGAPWVDTSCSYSGFVNIVCHSTSSVTLTSTTQTVDIQAALSADLCAPFSCAGAVGAGNATLNASDPLTLTLPAGATYTSASGVFLRKSNTVPEPSPLPMLLAGLGLIGGVFHFGRRKKVMTA